VALLPTPGKADGDGGHLNSEGFQSTLPGVARDMALLPSPRTSDTNGAGHHGDGGMDLRTAVAEIPLLPTPAVNDMGAAYTPETWDEWTATMKAKHNNGNGHGKSLNVEAQRLLPTPAARDSHNAGDPDRTADRMADRGQPLSEVAVNVLMPTPRATDGTKGGPNQRGSSGDLMLPSAVSSLLPTPTAQDSAQSGGGYNGQTNVTLTDATVRQPARWGEYEPAIRRWEAATRPAPEPTKPNSKGNPKLSDEFDEWLMGYPAGWITDVPGVTWNEALKACGNGVVPQQGAAGLRWLLAMGGAA
jgi:DNA (cytosine-5)-methyltransferase 1